MPLEAIDPETRLFVRFRDDADLDALGTLYDRTAAELLRVAMHLVRDPARAEDLVQQTFLAAIEAAPRFDATRRVRAWLIGILTHLAHKLLRQEARVAELPSAAVADPVQLAAMAEFTAQVDAAIDTLPDVYQPVLVLHLKHGMIAAEIAHALRRPPGTVRTQLVRALELLKQALPTSLALSFACLCTPLRGLTALKTAVMADATHHLAGTAAVASATASATMLSFGGGLLVKKLLAAMLGLVVAWSLYGLWPAVETPPSPTMDAPIAVVPAHADRSGPSATTPALAMPVNEREAVPPLPTHGSLRYRFLWEVDRTPAVGVFVHCVVWGRVNALMHTQDVSTDAHGEIRLDSLEPGNLGLYVDRCEGATAEITPGHESTGTHLLPRGITVDVTVQDDAGQPIPNALIWLSSYSNNYEGHEVGATDGAGHYTLRDVGEARSIAARADGFAPSLATSVLGHPGEHKSIVLTLSNQAASLRGIVRSADGQPAASATVWIMFPHIIDRAARVSGTPPPRVLRTDDAGRFTAAGCPTGELTVRARAHGFGSVRRNVRLTPDASPEIELRLPHAATVHGRVHDADGRPIAGVPIGGGERFGDVANCSTTSAADGSFTLTELTAGRVELSANHDGYLPYSTSLTLTAGERRELEFVLQRSTATDQIRGELVDERGAPLANWIVQLTETGEQGPWSAWLRTDADGRFVATGCPRGECTLAIFDADTKQHVHALLVVPGVARGAELRRIVVLDAARAVGELTGRIVDADGHPLTDAHCDVRTAGLEVFQRLTAAADGTFHAAGLPARRYELQLQAQDHTSFALPAIELGPGQRLDLGTLVLRRGGRITVETGGDVLATKRWLFARIREATGRSIAHVDLAAFKTSDPLPPGRYDVRIFGHEIAAMSRECVVRDGETTTVLAALTRGCNRTFAVRQGEHAKWSTVTLTVRDEHGQVVWDIDVLRRNLGAGGLVAYLGLGTWTITAKTDTGLTAEAAFSITDLDTTAEPIPLQLR